MAQATLAARIFTTERRRADRHEIAIKTLAGLSGRERVEIEIINIAEGGALLLSARELAEGTRVMIDLPGLGWVHAQIVWYFNGQHGCAFAQPLSTHYLNSVINLHALA
jgi:hypothetical protein